MSRRIVSLWFPRLASDRILRAQSVNAPFALIHTRQNVRQIYCLNIAAEHQGLGKGMSLSDARALCPDLRIHLANPQSDSRFLTSLARWARRYCPWVGFEKNGLVMDVSGSAHLFNTPEIDGEERMLADIRDRFNRARLSVHIGLADTRGGAWALARFANGPDKNAPPGETLAHISPLPVAALRIEPEITVSLQRLGLRTIGEVIARPRAALSRRFGPALLMRIDQALGELPEPVSPGSEPLRFAARLTLPEAIGLLDDVKAALARLLEPVCDKLAKHGKGARKLQFTLRRVDQASCRIEVALARPMCDAGRIAALFEKSLSGIDAGFGIDQVHLIVTQPEDLTLRQISHIYQQQNLPENNALNDLITRLGNRVGFDNITRPLPAQSHIPEKGFITAPAAYSQAEMRGWTTPGPRPLILFPPEIIIANSAKPPGSFRWRAMHFTTAKAIGPERIAPEWWLDDPNWRSGLRDYWRIHTRQGRRLWLFFTPQRPGWFVHGEFA